MKRVSLDSHAAGLAFQEVKQKETENSNIERKLNEHTFAQVVVAMPSEAQSR